MHARACRSRYQNLYDRVATFDGAESLSQLKQLQDPEALAKILDLCQRVVEQLNQVSPSHRVRYLEFFLKPVIVAPAKCLDVAHGCNRLHAG